MRRRWRRRRLRHKLWPVISTYLSRVRLACTPAAFGGHCSHASGYYTSPQATVATYLLHDDVFIQSTSLRSRHLRHSLLSGPRIIPSSALRRPYLVRARTHTRTRTKDDTNNTRLRLQRSVPRELATLHTHTRHNMEESIAGGDCAVIKNNV